MICDWFISSQQENGVLCRISMVFPAYNLCCFQMVPKCHLQTNSFCLLDTNLSLGYDHSEYAKQPQTDSHYHCYSINGCYPTCHGLISLIQNAIDRFDDPDADCEILRNRISPHFLWADSPQQMIGLTPHNTIRTWDIFTSGHSIIQPSSIFIDRTLHVIAVSRERDAHLLSNPFFIIIIEIMSISSSFICFKQPRLDHHFVLL